MGRTEEVFGLIGFPLSHSWSPGWFREKFRLTGDGHKDYHLFPLDSIEEFPDLVLKYPDLAGLNVTIPYKEKVIPYLDELDETARAIGAVNTIKITRKNGMIRTKGYNTDSRGFLQTLPDQIPDGPALILGTGGGAKAVAFALKEKNILYDFVSRSKSGPGIISYAGLTHEVINKHLLIVNTTPLGMYPETSQSPPIPYQYLSENHFLYDLIYNPGETSFLRQGRTMQAHTMNGAQMLINQAELSYRIFLDPA